jgi:hypothetical protein
MATDKTQQAEREVKRAGGWAMRVALVGLLSAGVAAGVLIGAGGCEEPAKKPQPPRYETLPPKNLPVFLKGTVLERMDHLNPEPLQVSNYGLVVNLPGTGDGTAPTKVREYIIKEMVKRGFGTMASKQGLEYLTPEKVLDNPRKNVAIVRVDGFMPPGVRQGQTFDCVVTALPDSGVTSLAGGSLYRTDLKFGGADVVDPAQVIEVQGKSEGPIFLNPTLTLNPKAATSDKNVSRTSRRQGILLDGGIADRDQPLILRMRAPQRSVVRQIEARIRQHFQDPGVASAKDEAILWLYVPASYRNDWERFVGVCMHLYLDGTPEVLLVRAKKLADEAMKPDALLQNISYAWEAMGSVALPAIQPLMEPGKPEDVQFAAARAAAFIGDPVAQQALQRMALTPTHRFQVDAVRTLGSIRPTPAVAAILRRLLDADSAVVRVEAYKALATVRSNAITSIYLPKQGEDEKFVLDVVPSSKPTVVYATRSGIPRIAIIGQPARLVTPITFTALDDRLSISSRVDVSADSAGGGGADTVTIFYRQEGNPRPVKVVTEPDLGLLIHWLGGASPDAGSRIELNYGEIVAIVQALADQKRLVSAGPRLPNGSPVAVNFVLQELSAVSDQLSDAPPIPARVRPQGDTPPGLPTSRYVGPEPEKKKE